MVIIIILIIYHRILKNCRKIFILKSLFIACHDYCLGCINVVAVWGQRSSDSSHGYRCCFQSFHRHRCVTVATSETHFLWRQEVDERPPPSPLPPHPDPHNTHMHTHTHILTHTQPTFAPSVTDVQLRLDLELLFFYLLYSLFKAIEAAFGAEKRTEYSAPEHRCSWRHCDTTINWQPPTSAALDCCRPAVGVHTRERELSVFFIAARYDFIKCAAATRVSRSPRMIQRSNAVTESVGWLFTEI